MSDHCVMMVDLKYNLPDAQRGPPPVARLAVNRFSNVKALGNLWESIDWSELQAQVE